jgi:hypothetical protein
MQRMVEPRMVDAAWWSAAWWSMVTSNAVTSSEWPAIAAHARRTSSFLRVMVGAFGGTW